MRKLFVFITALTTLLFLAGVAWAGQVAISGTHSKDEIKSTCASVGGQFLEGSGGSYMCVNDCGNGSTCDVSCNKDGKCVGDCPACGRRAPLPVLSGTAPIERTLKNSVRPSKQ